MLHFVRLEMMEFSTSLSSGYVAIINTYIYVQAAHKGGAVGFLRVPHHHLSTKSTPKQHSSRISLIYNKKCIYSCSRFLAKQPDSEYVQPAELPQSGSDRSTTVNLFIYSLISCSFVCR